MQMAKRVSIAAEGVGKSAILKYMLAFYGDKAKTTPAIEFLKCHYPLVVYGKISPSGRISHCLSMQILGAILS